MPAKKPNPPKQIVYLNGKYMSADAAKISIFDRGFLMADSVYDLTAVVDGRLLAFNEHIDRLQTSLKALDITYAIDRDHLLAIHHKLIKDNNLECGGVYIQISSGNPGERDFVQPDPEVVPPTCVMFTVTRPHPDHRPDVARGWRIISVPDFRWRWRHIKTTQLTYQSLVKTEATTRGYDDAWLVEEGFVTEGTSNNAYIVKDGVIITRQLSHDILHGITRAALLAYAVQHNLTVTERPFTIAEAQNADEAFITSAATFVTPVVEIDDKRVAGGKPGKHANALRKIYLAESLKTAL
ncbi:MAG: aminotransferase class IV [Proteobacteria bacterium]|nr:aminotransferase class IV [Pseudomonadota bacterium]